MKEFIKENFAILLAFALPVLLIVVVAVSAYLPSFFLSTDYNFVYTSCFNSTNRITDSCNTKLEGRYLVVDGKIAVNPEKKLSDAEVSQMRIFLHDTKKNESREITLEEAQTFTLNKLITSPDGVTVSSDYSRNADFFPFFGGSSSYGYYLKKGKSKDRLNLINNNDRYYYRNNFQFIGWVEPERDNELSTVKEYE